MTTSDWPLIRAPATLDFERRTSLNVVSLLQVLSCPYHIEDMQLRRADTSLSDDSELAHVTYNDKYVVVYNFADLGSYVPTRVIRL